MDAEGVGKVPAAEVGAAPELVTGLGVRAAAGTELRAGGLAAARKGPLSWGPPQGHSPPCPLRSTFQALCQVLSPSPAPHLSHICRVRVTLFHRGTLSPRRPRARREPFPQPWHSLAPALDDGRVLLGLERVAGRLGGGLQLTGQAVATGQRCSCEATGRRTQASLPQPAGSGGPDAQSQSGADQACTAQPAAAAPSSCAGAPLRLAQPLHGPEPGPEVLLGRDAVVVTCRL